jgi:hypothetical protein
MRKTVPGLSGRLLPLHPKLLPDEILTSWLLRTAHANGMKIQRLFDEALGRQVPTLQRDYDRSAPTEHLKRFSEITGESIKRLEASTLRVFAGTFVDKVRLNTGSSWILAAGTYHRKRRLHGLQYCPLCLKTDLVPYFRTYWRCAFYIECEHHYVQMEDACPKCDAPVVPFRVDVGNLTLTLSQPITNCHACGFDLRNAPTRAIQFATWELAVDLRNLLVFRWFERAVILGAHEMSTLEVFTDLHNFARLAVPNKKYALHPADVAVEELVNRAVHIANRKRQMIECMRVQDRTALLLLGIWVMQQWPHRFKAACISRGISVSRIRFGAKHWSRRTAGVR